MAGLLVAANFFFVDIGFQEPCKLLEVAIVFDESNDSNQCFGVYDFFKRDILKL